MLSLISPAKSLDFETPAHTSLHSQPCFLDEAQELAEQLKQLSPQQLSDLMSISDKLGTLNAARFEQWQQPFTPENAKAAVLAFTGDVYTGLDATSLDDEQLSFAQDHLRILSGLYGLLKPMDLIQPYRLEMGTVFNNKRGKDLYSFWRPLIAQRLHEELQAQEEAVVINLASQEYFKAVDTSRLNTRIITPVFKDWKNGQYKIISFYAKKARGMMCRYLISNKIDQPDGLKDFDLGGYSFSTSMSEGDSWVFTRKEV